MEQRPLRLGDIVDDYCPRERRVTNHAVVAIVEDAIRQTRCKTCDMEHLFKGGQEPKRRLRPALGRPATASTLIDVASEESIPGGPSLAVSSPTEELDAPALAGNADEPRRESTVAEFLAHRRLIRATLPKIEGEPPPVRAIPEFTMHQRPVGRNGRGFREQHGRGGDGGFFRSRPTNGSPHGIGNGSGGSSKAGSDDEDEINGNVVGPGPISRNGHTAGGRSTNAPQPPGGLRRRGRRRRGR